MKVTLSIKDNLSPSGEEAKWLVDVSERLNTALNEAGYEKACDDMMTFGLGITCDGKHVPLKDVVIKPGGINYLAPKESAQYRFMVYQYPWKPYTPVVKMLVPDVVVRPIAEGDA